MFCNRFKDEGSHEKNRGGDLTHTSVHRIIVELQILTAAVTKLATAV
jgi:hypothetical protein